MLEILFDDITKHDENFFKKSYLTLTLERKNKTDKYVQERDKKLSILAGYLLHKLIGDLDSKIVVNKEGKPYLENNKVFISISHSKDMVMVCKSDIQIGCDIEFIDKEELEIAERFFDKKEFEFIKKSLNPKQEFYKFWTIKEAYLKCVGCGLSELKNISINEGKKLNDKKYVIKETKLFNNNYWYSIVVKK